MAGQSKQHDKDAEENKSSQTNLTPLFLAQLTHYVAMNCLNQATFIMAKNAMVAAGAEKGATVALLNKMAAANAILEFLVNPLFGRLSDLYGRRMFLLLGPGITACLHFAIAKEPTVKKLIIGRIITEVLYSVFTTNLSATLADVFGEDEGGLAGANGRVEVVSGISVVVGSLLGSRLAAQDPAKSFTLSAAAAAISFLVVIYGFKVKSSQSEEERKEKEAEGVRMSDLNPLSFLWLFTKSSLMAKLNLAFALQQFPNYLGDVEQEYVETALGWGTEEVGQYESATGLADMAAGALTEPIIDSVGVRRHTVLTNAIAILTELVMGLARTSKQAYFAVVLRVLAAMRDDSIGSRITVLAGEMGIGQGKVAADRANLEAVVKTIAPLMFAYLFARGSLNAEESGQAFMVGLPYFASGGLLMLAQLIIQSFTLKEFSDN